MIRAILFDLDQTLIDYVKMKKMGRKWHLSKVIFEKWWLAPFGFTKEFYKQLMTIGAKFFGVQIKL